MFFEDEEGEAVIISVVFNANKNRNLLKTLWSTLNTENTRVRVELFSYIFLELNLSVQWLHRYNFWESEMFVIFQYYESISLTYWKMLLHVAFRFWRDYDIHGWI